MVERPIKRLRRLSTEDDDGERIDDWIPQKQGTAADDSPANATMSRSRRTAAPATAVATSSPTTPTVIVSRPNSHSPDDSTKKSIRLTVKMPPTKLREATSGRKATVGVNSRDAFEPGQRMLGSRRGSRKRYYEDESESEEDEDEEEDDIIPSEENDEEEDDDEEEEEEEEDAGGDEDVDVEGDVEMEDVPAPAPPPLVFKATAGSRPSVTVTPANEGKVKSVEAKEMEMEEDDDEELSELESEEEGEEEAGGGAGQDGDGEGEGEGEEEAQEEDEEDEGEESDNETPATGSRASTPDVSKMTKRQRSRLDQVMGGDFLQLPMEPQTKKHLTAEEHAMRRAEMARRRKNLSEKRNEEEKMDTINKLLKKQAPKRRGKEPGLVGPSTMLPLGGGGGGGENNATPHSQLDVDSFEKPNPLYVRWVSGREGCRVGVPEEWLGTPVGRVFGGAGGKMVEEV